MKYKIERILLYISFVLITLQSVYIPGVGPIFTFLGVIILTFLSAAKEKVFDKTIVSLLMIISVSFIIHISIVSFFSFGFNDLLSILSMLIMIICMSVIRPYIINNKSLLKDVIKAVIIFHVVVILIQILTWITTKSYIDFFELISGRGAGNFSKKGIMAFGLRVPRFSGFFNEPGSYSVTVMTFIIIYYLLINKIDYIIIFSTLSCLVTMSGFGIILVSFFYSMVLFTNKKYAIKVSVSCFFVFVVFYLIGGFDSFLSRFSNHSNYSGLDFRGKMFDFLFSDFSHIIYGIQISSMPKYFVPNDLGVWFIFTSSYGFLGVIIIFSIISYIGITTRRFDCVVFICLLMMTKLKHTYPLFWISIIIISCVKFFKDENE